MSKSVSLKNDSIKIDNESWFIPNDIIMMVLSLLLVFISFTFVILILIDKTLHNVRMILIGNTYVITFVLGCILSGIYLFTYKNDFRQIEFEDSLCQIRGFILSSFASIYYNSFVLQALHRYLFIIYRTRTCLRSKKMFCFLIVSTWIIGFLYSLPSLFNGYFIYNVNNQICQLPLGFYLISIYTLLTNYIIPISLIISIYIRLLVYIHKITVGNIRIHIEKEMKMVRLIVLLVSVLIIICFPVTLFVLISYFTSPPKYHFRIGHIFVNISLLSVTILLFIYTKPLQKSLRAQFSKRHNIIANQMN